MGTDINTFVEKKNKETSKWEEVKDFNIFDWRNYSIFAFLAGVRNYDHCEPLAEPKGLPDDSEYLNTLSDDGYEKRTEKSMLQNDYSYHSFGCFA